MSKTGRPKGPKNSQKQPFATRLKPSLIKRIEARAKKEDRSKNYIVEIILESHV